MTDICKGVTVNLFLLKNGDGSVTISEWSPSSYALNLNVFAIPGNIAEKLLSVYSFE